MQLPTETIELMNFIIETVLLSPTHPTMKSAYYHYVIACNQKGLYKASYATFRRHASKVISEKNPSKTGETSANRLEPSCHELAKTSQSHIVDRYPSSKMGGMIQFESHKNEFYMFVLCEFDAEGLEFYDQPLSFRLAKNSDQDFNVKKGCL